MLFSTQPQDRFHRWYNRLADLSPLSDDGRRVRRFCELAYKELRSALDDDFDKRFRLDTPQRFAELYFGKALLDIGWTLEERVSPFDFHFKDLNGQSVLVEVVTPTPISREGIERHSAEGGTTITSMSGKAREASLTRLTSAFYDKTKLISEKKLTRSDDRIVIAISGLRLSQEGYWPIGATGLPADFIEAFLPIGPISATFKLRKGAQNTDCTFERNYCEAFYKANGVPIYQTAFFNNDFSYIDAIIYSEMSLLSVDCPSRSISALFNPASNCSGFEIPVGCQYRVDITDSDFSVTRAIRPDCGST